MKRTQEDAVEETYLYWLPHELLIEILQIAFTEIGVKVKATHRQRLEQGERVASLDSSWKERLLVA